MADDAPESLDADERERAGTRLARDGSDAGQDGASTAESTPAASDEPTAEESASGDTRTTSEDGDGRTSEDAGDERPSGDAGDGRTDREAGEPSEPGDDREDADGGAAGDADEGDADEMNEAPERTDADQTSGDDVDPEFDDAGQTPDDVAGSADPSAGRNAPAAGPEGARGPTDGRADEALPDDVRKYERFTKMDGAAYERVNGFLRDRTHITAREWAIARLCSDFRTDTGVEMTKIGENLPELVPFMTDTYSPQAVNQARSSFEEKVRKAGATFLYGAMCNFFTAEELDDVMYEVTEVAKFLLEVEGVDLTVEEELEAEDHISSVMRDVRSASDELRHESTCPNCGHELSAED